jgi:DNA-directed RNA polymerase subunit RPC12/RpoP
MSALFDKQAIPRQPRVVRMHVADAGHGFRGNAIRFECATCGHDTGWVKDEWTITENRRGHPCPTCNDKGGAA